MITDFAECGNQTPNIGRVLVSHVGDTNDFGF